MSSWNSSSILKLNFDKIKFQIILKIGYFVGIFRRKGVYPHFVHIFLYKNSPIYYSESKYVVNDKGVDET